AVARGAASARPPSVARRSRVVLPKAGPHALARPAWTSQRGRLQRRPWTPLDSDAPLRQSLSPARSAAWARADPFPAWLLAQRWRARKGEAPPLPRDRNRRRAVDLPNRSAAKRLQPGPRNSKTDFESEAWSALRCRTICGSGPPSSARESNFALASP